MINAKDIALAAAIDAQAFEYRRVYGVDLACLSVSVEESKKSLPPELEHLAKVFDGVICISPVAKAANQVYSELGYPLAQAAAERNIQKVPVLWVGEGVGKVLNTAEKKAVLAHEVAHITLRHIERSELDGTMKMSGPVKFMDDIRKEMEADRFAVKQVGSALPLITALTKILDFNNMQDDVAVMERIKVLRAM